MINPFKKRDSEIEALRKELTDLKNDISITDSQAFKELFLGIGSSSAGVINADTVMRASAVFACVRLISGALASAPLQIYQEGDDGEFTKEYNHPYKKILGLSPNGQATAATFWKTMGQSKILQGDAYAAIVRGKKTGRPIGLMQLRWQRVKVYQAWEIGLSDSIGVAPERLYYDVSWDNGTKSLVDQDDMIHVPNIGWNGKNGLSTIQAGARAMGLALSSEESAASLFENGMVSQVALSYPNKMGKDAQDILRQHLREKYSGAQNHNNPLILTEGGTVQHVSMNPQDVQLLDSRKFSVIDIARFFGVPPAMIGESEKTSSWGSGVEQMARWFTVFTMNEHFVSFEQELERKLFRGSGYMASFDESLLIRGDMKTQAEYYKSALGGTQGPGWLTPNEVRIKTGETLSKDENANKLYVPKEKEAIKNEQTTGTVQP